MKESFPSKPVTAVLEDEIEYCQQVVAVIEQDGRFAGLPKVSEPLNLLQETIADDVEHLQTSADPDAKVGHKYCTQQDMELVAQLNPMITRSSRGSRSR